jgi:16S rRNA (cytosine967-C5)-methyltransferase
MTPTVARQGEPAAGVAPRRVAIEALVRIEEGGAYANLVVPALLKRSRLAPEDRHFVTELAYGATRRRRALDHLIDGYLLRPVDGPTRAALRIGAYQLAMLRVPPHAAVFATVEATSGPARKLVNAVLRRLGERLAQGPPAWPDDATRLSYPDWLVARLDDALGPADGRAALEAMNRPARVTERDDGYIQDRASQWVGELVDARAGQRVADLCAAPGGKATFLAERGATVAALDRSPARARLLAGNGRHLHVERLAAVVADGRFPPLRPSGFERVLVDAPCSGLGALGRRPDARWRIQPDAAARLAELQRQLLLAGAELLAPGGVLVYSVCTLDRAETIDVDEVLAATRPELVALPAPTGPWRPLGRGGLLLPQEAGTDGMYVLRVQRADPGSHVEP